MLAEPATEDRPSRLRFYSVVTLPAAVLMALEIVSSRLLAPHFGNSVYVWGSIISVFLGTMSAGYWIGGRWADRRPDMLSLGQIILASAVCQAFILISGRSLVAWFGDLTAGRPEGVLLATAALFGPPTVFLAMVSPYAVKIATRELSALGGTAGHLYALSTAGSLFGTLGATFFLIPRLALEPIFATLLGLTAISGLLGIGPEWRQRKVLVALGALLLGLAVLPSHLLNSTNIDAVTERLSPYQTLRVVDAGGVRYMYSDGTLHSAIHLDGGETAVPYNRLAAAALIFAPEMERMAILGMGAGGVGKYVQSLRSQLVVDYVEVDRAVAEIATEYFAFESGPHHLVHIEDGRRFLADRPDQRWDFIYADTYIGQSIPFHMVTREFIHIVRDRLSQGGVFGMNVVTELDTPLSLGLLRGLSESFRTLYVLQAPPGNYLFLASNQADRLDPEELLAAADDVKDRLARRPRPGLEELASRMKSPDVDLADAVILTDRYAPANDLLRQSVDRSTFGVEVGDQVSDDDSPD